jgi:hypothetical protein
MGPNFPVACVIAQQYSSTSFVSLRFHYHKEKFGALLKMVLLRFSSSLKSA